MNALAAAINSQEDNTKENRASFEALCRELNVDGDTRSAAWQILDRIPSRENVRVIVWRRFTGHREPAQTPEHQAYWRACALYVAGSAPMQAMIRGASASFDKASSTTTSTPSTQTALHGASFSLAALLRASDIRLVDFFEPLKSFVSFLRLGVNYEEQLRLLEKSFVVAAIVFQKYESCIAHLLRSVDSSATSAAELRSVVAFGWDLFLVAKGKLLGTPVDLIDAFHVLLCIVDVVLVHAPDRLRAISLERVAEAVAAARASLNENVSAQAPASPTLAYLCAHNRAPYNEVRQVQTHLVTPLLATLRDNGILKHRPARLPSHVIVANSLFMGGLLDTFLFDNGAAVQREYELLLASVVGVSFDERLFIQRPEQLGSPTRVSMPSAYYYATGGRAGLRGAASPSLMAPPTPINAAQTTIQWLVQAVAHVDDTDGAPASLGTLLTGSAGNDANVIQSLLVAGHARVTQWLAQLDVHPKSRASHVRKLYYRLLEAMMCSELRRLPSTERRVSEVGALLRNEHFHRSLVACSFEIVVVAYKMTQTFPYSIGKLELVAVDMYKIIELALKHEPLLPSRIVRHLTSVEESVLESTAWVADSPIWLSLQSTALDRDTIRELCSWSVADGNSAFAGTSAGMAVAEVMPVTLDAIAELAEPRAAASTAPARPPQSVLLLLRKVLQLIAIRSFTLSRNLNLPVDVFQEIWSALVYACTSQRILRLLLRDRHIDQIIICTIYGVCKAQTRALTFRTIIDAYRRAMPESFASVYRDVRIGDADQGDIILFYNKAFIAVMERPLLELHARAIATNSNAACLADVASVVTVDRSSISETHQQQQQQQLSLHVQQSSSNDDHDDSEAQMSPRTLSSLGGNKLLLSPLSPQRKVLMSPYSMARSSQGEGVSMALSESAGSNDAGLRNINETMSPRVRRAPKRLFEAI